MSETVDAAENTAPEEPTVAGVTLLELREGQCKFPLYGTLDTVYRFCGAATGGQVYCPHHRGIAYAGIPTRRLR